MTENMPDDWYKFHDSSMEEMLVVTTCLLYAYYEDNGVRIEPGTVILTLHWDKECFPLKVLQVLHEENVVELKFSVGIKQQILRAWRPDENS